MAPVWGAVQTEVVRALKALTPEHEFALILYNAGTDVFSRRWHPGEPAVVEKAIEWVTSISARGATDPEPAIRQALRMKGIEALVLLSDIRFKGPRLERIYGVLKLATKGTKSFAAIDLYFLPLVDSSGSARIQGLASGTPMQSLLLRLRGVQRR